MEAERPADYRWAGGNERQRRSYMMMKRWRPKSQKEAKMSIRRLKGQEEAQKLQMKAERPGISSEIDAGG